MARRRKSSGFWAKLFKTAPKRGKGVAARALEQRRKALQAAQAKHRRNLRLTNQSADHPSMYRTARDLMDTGEWRWGSGTGNPDQLMRYRLDDKGRKMWEPVPKSKIPKTPKGQNKSAPKTPISPAGESSGLWGLNERQLSTPAGQTGYLCPGCNSVMVADSSTRGQRCPNYCGITMTMSGNDPTGALQQAVNQHAKRQAAARRASPTARKLPARKRNP